MTKLPLLMAAICLLACCTSKKSFKKGWQYDASRWTGRSLLSPTVENETKDFVLLINGTITIDQPEGSDSFAVVINRQVVYVPRFYISKYEVTVGEYNQFCRATNDLTNKPDTDCFRKDFGYIKGEPMNVYFWHPAREHYPVCGVSMEQVQRYCDWKTQRINALIKEKDTTGHPVYIKFRLPTFDELEYAIWADVSDNGFKPARKENYHTINTGDIKDAKGNIIKRYFEDDADRQSPVYAYSSNDVGLFNTRGNVAEWTQSRLSQRFVLDTALEGNVLQSAHYPLSDTAFVKISPAI